MLIRMIGSIGKWMESIQRNGALFTGDIIADLRTYRNTISTWYTPDGVKDIENIALALSSNRQDFCKLTLVKLDENELSRLGIEFHPEPAIDCPVKNSQITGLHYDLFNIDYWHLGFLAEHIIKQIEKDAFRTFTVKEIKKLISDSYSKGLLDETKLSDTLKAKLNAAAMAQPSPF